MADQQGEIGEEIFENIFNWGFDIFGNN